MSPPLPSPYPYASHFTTNTHTTPRTHTRRHKRTHRVQAAQRLQRQRALIARHEAHAQPRGRRHQCDLVRRGGRVRYVRGQIIVIGRQIFVGCQIFLVGGQIFVDGQIFLGAGGGGIVLAGRRRNTCVREGETQQEILNRNRLHESKHEENGGISPKVKL